MDTTNCFIGICILSLICTFSPALAFGNTTTVTDCLKDSKLYPGGTSFVFCRLKANVTSGIRWYRGNEEIVTCTLDGICTVLKYKSRISIPYNGSSLLSHIMSITRLTEEDFEMNWLCADVAEGEDPSTEDRDQSCTITRGLDFITDCGSGTVVGKSQELTCTVASADGNYNDIILWYRNGFPFISCLYLPSGHYCFFLNTGSVSTENIEIIDAFHLNIKSVVEDHMTGTWSCFDSSILNSSCSLFQVTTTGPTNSSSSSPGDGGVSNMVLSIWTLTFASMLTLTVYL